MSMRPDPRSAPIQVRLTREERERLDDLIDVYGGSRSNLLRSALFQIPLPKSRLDSATFAELKRQGHNLNQIARRINGGETPPEREVIETLVSVREQLVATERALLNVPQKEDA
jgi:predicted transcriptional regulator